MTRITMVVMGWCCHGDGAKGGGCDDDGDNGGVADGGSSNCDVGDDSVGMLIVLVMLMLVVGVLMVVEPKVILVLMVVMGTVVEIGVVGVMVLMMGGDGGVRGARCCRWCMFTLLLPLVWVMIIMYPHIILSNEYFIFYNFSSQFREGYKRLLLLRRCGCGISVNNTNNSTTESGDHDVGKSTFRHDTDEL